MNEPSTTSATRSPRDGSRSVPLPLRFDVLIVGGGPAGSTAARALTRAGRRVAVLDSQSFPRDKPCGGWLSPDVWPELGLSPRQYPRSLWKWDHCHVQHGRVRHRVAGIGYFIRRFELDAFLLERSGAEVFRHTVRDLVRDEGIWRIDSRFEAPIVIGAGGTHCPVARTFGTARKTLVAAQECEFRVGADAVAETRVGLDGEPELLLHEDWGGYSWNVPKGDWLNVGTGTSAPRQVRAAWSSAREYFLNEGHVPPTASIPLSNARGHSYYLFQPAHLASCERDGLLIAGDALGLSHPLTGEGILPAVLSGRLAAEAVLRGSSYRRGLERHPVIRDYALAEALLALVLRLSRSKLTVFPMMGAAALGPALQSAAARGFGNLFAGSRLAGSSLLGAGALWMRGLEERSSSR